MDILKKATELFGSKLNNAEISQNVDKMQAVLGDLLSSGKERSIDLGGIVDKLKNSGLGNVVDSWLGDGENARISKAQLEKVFDSSKLNDAAEQLGTKKEELLAGLQNMLPQVVDMSSRGGQILDSVKDELAGLAKKFLK